MTSVGQIVIRKINFHPVSLYKQMPLYSQGTAQQCYLNLLTLGCSASQLSIHANWYSFSIPFRPKCALKTNQYH